MGFVVTHPGGTKDAEFEAYARLLRQKGKDLGNLPRVPDPEDPKRRWAYVWSDEAEARRFAEELSAETGNGPWRVDSTATPPSHGPFGPILIQLARRADGLVFALHPLSLAMIRESFPQARPAATSSFIDPPAWNRFREAQRSLHDLVEEVGPTLTGLEKDQFIDLGYAVVDADTDRTWVYTPPAAVARN
jgi:hypothetical protein